MYQILFKDKTTNLLKNSNNKPSTFFSLISALNVFIYLSESEAYILDKI